MKVIDRTPLQDAQGNISVVARAQGTLKYGPNWFPELEAQKVVIAQLDRLLDKGCVLIRNFNLPGSEIVIPMILIGPGTCSIIFVTPVKGHFEVKGTAWNTVNNSGVSTPAKRNLVDLLLKLSRAFQKYLQIHNIKVPMPIEPVLIASDPGANIESVGPAVRVVRSDAVKQFANVLNTSSPVLRAEQVLVLADLILEPLPHSGKEAPEPLPPQVEQPISRAQAIFKAAETAPPVPPPLPRPEARAQPAPPPQQKARGMSRGQIVLLAGLFIIECCVVIVGAYFLYFLN